MLRLEFGDCRLTAGWWITALTVVGVLLFGQLGRWQWHRAEEQRALATAFAAGAADFASALGTRTTGGLPRYAQVRVLGEYDSAHQFLLDNISHGGRAGYQVLTPFRLDDGRLLLVNRGWVPLPAGSRDTLPDVALPELGLINIGGRLDLLPVAGLASGVAAPGTDAIWPKRTSFPSIGQLGSALGRGVEPRQLLLGETETHGYVRDWHQAALGFGPERHIAYAAQWWGLGALILFLYLFMNLECRP